jgi:signal peptidase I
MKYPPEIHKPTPIYPKRSRLRKFCPRQIYKLGITIHLVIIGFLLTFICWWVLANTQLHLCLTPSLDGARVLLFCKTSTHEIQRGNIVYIRGHDYRYLGPQPYAKRVIGFPGEKIIYEKNTIKIRERTFPLIDKTLEGQPLTPIAHDAVPQGYFFVAGDHPRSIDSRYEEFGLVPVGKVWGKEIFSW